MKRALLAATLLAVPFAAHAQPVTGLYVGGGAGGNFMQPSETEVIQRFGSGGDVFRYKTGYDAGFVGVGSIGYGFGNGVRIEIEGDYRYNKFDNKSGAGFGGGTPAEQKYGGMANALFDFDIGSPYIWPYVGIGAGYMHVDHGYSNFTSNAFAYQGIAGISVPIPFVVGLSATLEYRFQAIANSKRTDYYPAAYSYPATTETDKFYNDLNHSVLIGLRYAFNVPPPAVESAAPASMAAPVAAPARSYLVFFDWDRADLTARARQIIAEAAAAIPHVQHTRIEVNGHADRSGTPQYNQGLSLRRAEAVSAELVKDGVSRSDITIQAFGDTKPLVPTAAGVREPQNRRVEIIIR
jgi:OOP family OmpA-OmpF porin